jgi:hypothetical protein
LLPSGALKCVLCNSTDKLWKNMLGPKMTDFQNATHLFNTTRKYIILCAICFIVVLCNSLGNCLNACVILLHFVLSDCFSEAFFFYFFFTWNITFYSGISGNAPYVI